MASRTRATLGFFCLPREAQNIAELYGAARLGGRIVVSHHPRQGGKRSAQVAVVKVYLQNRFWRHGLKWGLIGWAIGFAMALWFFCPRAAHAAWEDETDTDLVQIVEDPELDTEPRYDFSDSRFGTEHLTTDLCDSICAQSTNIAAVLATENFIATDNPRVDARRLAEMLHFLATDYPLVPIGYIEEIMARESSFDVKAHNYRTNCEGLWQLMRRWHYKRMTSMGWDWYNPEHNARYGCWLITQGLNKQGITKPEQVTPQALWNATWYWEVRPAAFAAWRARE